MKIIDLSPENEKLYCQCLEDWSDEIREAGDHKWRWYQEVKEKGLRVKLATDDEGIVGGMIQYLPIALSPVEGEGLYFILCIWVHGYKQGRGNFQKKGMGQALIEAAEKDAVSQGASGIAAWGVSLPFWMRASWFRKQGYRNADKEKGMVLLWKPFCADAKPPRWIRPKKKPKPIAGKVAVTAFQNGWCPAMSLAFERSKRAAAEFGDRVQFCPVDTLDRSTFLEWGISDALFIDGKEVRTGPPPSYKKIHRLIRKRVRKAE